jgi:Tol biopolymer transport system component
MLSDEPDKPMTNPLYRRSATALIGLCAAGFVACSPTPPTLRPVVQPTETSAGAPQIADGLTPTTEVAVPLRPPTDLPTEVTAFTLPAIVFESNRSGRYEIYAMNDQGRDLEQVTDSMVSGAEGSGSPEWSPDGHGVAFSSKRNGDWDLYLLRDGAETNLTQAIGEDDKAAWSPDGAQLLFSSVRGGLRWADIFLMDTDGSRVVDLTADSDDDREPVWSPSGDEIAYRSFRDGNYDLYALDLASHAPRQLTKTNAPVWNASPAWSPDGKWIAFETNRDGNYEVYIMDNNGAQVRNVTNNPKDDKEPAWSPDGTQIAFSSDRDGNFELYTMSVASGAVTRLTYDCGRDHNPDWRRGADLDGAAVTTAVAFVTRDGNLRSGPDVNASTVSGVVAEECLTVTGRSSDGQWFQVRTTQGKAAWVARGLVNLQGNFDSVPVSS